MVICNTYGTLTGNQDFLRIPHAFGPWILKNNLCNRYYHHVNIPVDENEYRAKKCSQGPTETKCKNPRLWLQMSQPRILGLSYSTTAEKMPSAAASHLQDIICNLCNGVWWPSRLEIRGRGIEWRRDSQDDNKLVRLVMKAKSRRSIKWSNILLMGWVSSEHKSDYWIKGINGQACQSCHRQSYWNVEDGSFNKVNWWEETTWGGVEWRIKIWRPVWDHGRTNDTFLRSCLWLQTKPSMGVYIQLADKAQQDDWPWEKWDQHDT